MIFSLPSDFRKNTLTRLALSCFFVLIGLATNFNAIRVIHTKAILGLLHLMNVDYLIMGQYSFSVNNLDLLVASSCTSIAAFAGSIPIFWKSGWELKSGLMKTLQYFAIFEILNILRLAFGLALFDKGFSWNVTHAIPAGVFYFYLLYWALNNGQWVRRHEKARNFLSRTLFKTLTY